MTGLSEKLFDKMLHCLDAILDIVLKVLVHFYFFLQNFLLAFSFFLLFSFPSQLQTGVNVRSNNLKVCPTDFNTPSGYPGTGERLNLDGQSVKRQQEAGV